VFVYCPDYYADLKGHVFPVAKYRMLYERLLEGIQVSERLFLTPEPATEEQLLLVHTHQYLAELRTYKHSERTHRSELPLTREVVDWSVLSAGGSILAAREALKSDGYGVCMNIGGGFHHAFPDHAEGFCYINDVAVAIRAMKAEGLVTRVAIIDLDLHQGNGTAAIFQYDPDVFTFSMHQEHLYPRKERSDLDIGLDIGVSDLKYLSLLGGVLHKVLDQHQPQLVVYLAGADPYQLDQLGGLCLTIGGLKERDRRVYHECRKRDIPVVTLLAGGYAERVWDTVTIHYNTCLEMMRNARISLDLSLTEGMS